MTTQTEARALKGRVMVVDDNPMNQTLARTMIGRLGLDVQIIETGEATLEALALPDAVLPQVILLDCQLPGIDGYETAAQIRANPSEKIKSIPIVALTGNVFPWDLDKCFAIGMNDYMTKPFKLEDLRKVLEKFLPIY